MTRHPLDYFKCSRHWSCIQINDRHTGLEAYVKMPFHRRQIIWDKADVSHDQRLMLYLAEGFPPLGVGRLPD